MIVSGVFVTVLQHSVLYYTIHTLASAFSKHCGADLEVALHWMIHHKVQQRLLAIKALLRVSVG